MLETIHLLEETDFPPITRLSLDTLQVNLGYKCNQRCLHCHVNAGPTRTEMMNDENLTLVLQVLEKQNIKTLDLTGGAPEMHPKFCELVKQARAMDIHVMDRCNLTILTEPGYEHMAVFLTEQQVEVVASLPCYSQANVDKQRGDGVFEKSIQALKMLNQLGYGGDQGLVLNLVYNPGGALLPPNQAQLEADYKTRLMDDFGIQFSQLFALANMPIKRFGSTLLSKGEFEPYMQLLKDNYQSANLAGLMCRSMVSVDYQGDLYDCDFNQQLAMNLGGKGKRHLRDLLDDSTVGSAIAIADHCYGCTAGQGSSCGGAL
ncbi:MAG: arsenosugar biosynthesis radical SAM protein ArsS [Pseudomonadota bacterium]|nr:arsenosugar biosynthesis radical SAM protein ArsS [Pseudomonadota bacterium]